MECNLTRRLVSQYVFLLVGSKPRPQHSPCLIFIVPLCRGSVCASCNAAFSVSPATTFFLCVCVRRFLRFLEMISQWNPNPGTRAGPLTLLLGNCCTIRACSNGLFFTLMVSQELDAGCSEDCFHTRDVPSPVARWDSEPSDVRGHRITFRSFLDHLAAFYGVNFKVVKWIHFALLKCGCSEFCCWWLLFNINQLWDSVTSESELGYFQLRSKI